MKLIFRSLFQIATTQFLTQIAHWYKLRFEAKDLQLLPYYWAMVPDNQIMNNNLIRK